MYRMYVLAPCPTPARSFRASRGIKRERQSRAEDETKQTHSRGHVYVRATSVEEEREEETDGTRERKIEMENEHGEGEREREKEKKRPEIKIQSFRPVLHRADEDNGIPRYFLPVHGIFPRVNTRRVLSSSTPLEESARER